MRRFPAARLAVATALVLSSGCAVAPPPSPSGPLATSAVGSTSPPGDEIVLVGWATKTGGTTLLLVDASAAVASLTLPAVPNGPVTSGINGPLAFLSGAPVQPLLWTSDVPPRQQAWSSRELVPAAASDEPFESACLGPDGATELAIQSSNTSVHLVAADRAPREVPPPAGLFRPGGCAWTNSGHLLVPLDLADPGGGIAFAMIRTHDGAARVLLGGGEHPAAAERSIAHAFRVGSSRSIVVVRGIPAFEGPLPDVAARIETEGDRDLFRPVLAADGSRLAALERDASGDPARLIAYDLTGEPAIFLHVDVRFALDAGPAWIAPAAQGG